jgi:hypothetical protein
MKLKGNVVFNGILLMIFAVAFFISLKWPAKARMYPMLITTAGMCFSGFLVFMAITGKDAVREQKKAYRKKAAKESGEAAKQVVTVQSELKMIFWLALFIAISLVMGFWVSMILYIPLFMRLYGKESWKTVGIFTAAIWVTIFIAFHVVMEVSLFGGVFNLGWD